MKTSKTIRLLAAEPSDGDRLAELRAEALFDSLNRLGRYSEEGVRERFYRSFEPSFTRIVEADGEFAGCIALKPAEEGYLLEHFYLRREARGSGIGAEVLRGVLAEAAAASPATAIRLNVLQGSSARRLYERFGFETEREDEIDVFMVLRPQA